MRLFFIALSLSFFIFPLPCFSDRINSSSDKTNSITIIDHNSFISKSRNQSSIFGKILPVADSLHPAKKALQFITKKTPPKPWKIQSLTKIQQAIHKKDLLLLQFRARTLHTTDETGEGFFTVYVQTRGFKNKKIFKTKVSVGRDWKVFSFPFYSNISLLSNHAELGFATGYSPQTIEIAQVNVLNYQGAVSIDQLPNTFGDYVGREEGSAWRIEAERRIEKFRKTSLTLHIPNPSDWKVHITQLRHHFYFGSAVSASMLMGEGPSHDSYRTQIKKLFNQAVLQNDLKWPIWELRTSQYNQQQTLRALRWLKEQDIRTRGHVLIWPSFRKMPKRIQRLQTKPEQLRTSINKHFRSISGATHGFIDEWDVLNEPFDHHDIMDILGKKEMVHWFNFAQKENRDTPLFLNDNGQLSSQGKTNTPHQRHFIKTARYLLEHNAPLGGLGLQSHFGSHLPPLPTIKLLLDRYASLQGSSGDSIPIQITELDINVSDEKLQADYLRDFMTMAFSHPAVRGITFWGFWREKSLAPSSCFI